MATLAEAQVHSSSVELTYIDVVVTKHLPIVDYKRHLGHVHMLAKKTIAPSGIAILSGSKRITMADKKEVFELRRLK